MGKVIAAITTSVDGYIVGPQDGPEHGLGIGGERLHYWVMGGPWTYADDGHDTDGMHGADREYYESLTEGLSCGIVGRNMYDAAGAWGGTNPFPGTLIVLTHRTENQPDPSTGFLFIDGFDTALLKARRRISDALYRQLVTDAGLTQPTAAGAETRDAEAGPGGHSGASSRSSAADLSTPVIGSSEQPLPGPVTPTLPPPAAPANPQAGSAPRPRRRRAGAVKVQRPTGRTNLTATSAGAHSRKPKPRF